MIDTVIVFGDSFNYGHGCKDRIFYYDQKTKQQIGTLCPENSPSQYSWGSLLQEKYPQIKVHNFANPGRSNQQIFRDFLSYSETRKIRKENHLVFFQISNPDRIEIRKGFDEIHSYVLSNAATHHHDIDKAARTYIRDMYHEKIGENVGFMTILGAYALAKLQHICNFYWTCSRMTYPSNTYDFLLSHYELKRHSLVDIRNLDFSNCRDNNINKLYRAPDNHVNELGHQIYFENIIDPIVKKHI